MHTYSSALKCTMEQVECQKLLELESGDDKQFKSTVAGHLRLVADSSTLHSAVSLALFPCDLLPPFCS